jgi:hypothetical protein
MTLNSLSSNSTPITPYCTYDKTHNSKGKVKNMMMNYAIKVTDGVNKLAESIKIGIAEESSKNTEDDW